MYLVYWSSLVGHLCMGSIYHFLSATNLQELNGKGKYLDFFVSEPFVLLETYICQDWRKKHFSYEIQKCFCFTIQNLKDLYSLFGSDISISAWSQIMFENQGLIADLKEYLHWLMIWKIILHFGKNASKERPWLVSVICFML